MSIVSDVAKQALKRAMLMTKPIRYAADSWLYGRFGDRQKLEKLRDEFKGRPLLIVGNGPSLNETPLDAFAGIPSIGMNKIDLIFSRTKWRPSMILCTNPVVVRQHAEKFVESDIPIYLTWKSRFMISRRKARNVLFFNMPLEESFSTDVSERVGSGPTVTYAALQFAYYVGADPVIIVGVDHNFDKTGDHIYERRKGPDVNHFDPNYFASGAVWGLPNLDGSELVYQRSREAYEAAGRRIVDATIRGKLQVFEKVSIDEAIKMAQLAHKQSDLADSSGLTERGAA